MRVISGIARGRKISAPSGLHTRPTADRVKQTLFDVLGQRCDGFHVLDLFAGSGALGIEALSRGAKHVVFVENNRKAQDVLLKNLAITGFEHCSTVFRTDVFRGHFVNSGPFDLILADPPYNTELESLLEFLSSYINLFIDSTRIVIEHSCRQQPKSSGNLLGTDQRVFGDTMLTFYKLVQENS